MKRLRFSFVVTLLPLVVGVGCEKPTPPAEPVVWPKDSYQPSKDSIPDLDLNQFLTTVVESAPAPYEQLKERPPVAAYHLLTRLDPRGHVFVEATLMFNRDSSPIVVQLTDFRGRGLMFHAGQNGQVHSFRWTAGSHSLSTLRIPVGAKVKGASVVVLGHEGALVRVDPTASTGFRSKVIRFPKVGEVAKLPLTLALAFELDNGQTLASIRVIDKRGRSAADDYDHRLATADLTPAGWKSLLESILAGSKPELTPLP